MKISNENNNYWLNKKAKIDILKDRKRLIYTAHIVEFDDKHITFLDNRGVVYSFNRTLIQEMQEISNNERRN